MTIGILTKANQSNVENTHGTVKEAISLAYNEYQIQIKTSSSEKIEETTKIASTEMVRIQGEETKETASGTETSFWDFLVGKRYIDGTTGIVDTKELTGQTLSLGNGSGNSDVYKIEEASEGYVLKYYDEGENPEILWQINNSTNSGLSETELKEKLQQVEGDAFIDSNGNIFDTDIYDTRIVDEESFSLYGDYYTGNSYHGNIIDGNLEYEIPIYLKQDGKIYKLTEIGDYAFSWQNELMNISIPDSVTLIGENAFENCKKLVSVTIPQTVTLVERSAFYGCDNLIDITILNGETILEESVFQETAWYNAQPDGLVYIGEILYEYKGEMAENTKISIKEGTKQISYSVFASEYNLIDVKIPNTVKIIGERAFSSCDGLTNITIPDSVTSIGNSAFAVCNGLTSINIPSSVTTIGEGIFDGCKNVTNMSVDANNKYYDSRNNCNAIIEKNSNTLLYGCKNTIIPNGVVNIGKNAFWFCEGLTSITIPNSVTSIEGGAFYECTGLTSIIIPDSVTSIGESAFEYCKGLTSITIPDSVTSLEDSAFSNCTGLTSVKISNNLTTIGWRVFYKCSNLTSIIIPDGVTSIERYAFQNCSKLASIVIPNSTTIIRRYAFSNCGSLQTVNYKGTEEEWNKITIEGDNEDLTNAEIKCN